MLKFQISNQMNSQNSQGANNTNIKTEKEIQYFTQGGQNVQNFSNRNLGQVHNNPEGGTDTIRNRLVFADTRSASEFQYYAGYQQFGPNFQNANNGIFNSEIHQMNSTYSPYSNDTPVSSVKISKKVQFQNLSREKLVKSMYISIFYIIFFVSSPYLLIKYFFI